jgi:hypothetical protein
MVQLKPIGPLVVALLLLAGCAGFGGAPAARDEPPSPPPPKLPAPSPAESALALGLTQTLSPEQVRQSFRIGRLDPFAAANDTSLLPQASGSAVSPEQISASLKELQVQGLVQVSGRQAVFVTFQGQSGEVFPGQVGGADTPFLPQGWRVLRIHASRGQIELANASATAIIEL